MRIKAIQGLAAAEGVPSRTRLGSKSFCLPASSNSVLYRSSFANRAERTGVLLGGGSADTT